MPPTEVGGIFTSLKRPFYFLMCFSHSHKYIRRRVFSHRQADSFRSANIHYRSNIHYRHANTRDNPDEKNILKFFAVSPTIRAERFVI